MAGFNLPLETRYRICVVDGRKAIFHGWTNWSEIVEPSLSIGGHSGGTIRGCLGIVEFEDGIVTRVYPEKIRFLDSAERFEGYDWSCLEEETEK